MTSVTSNNKYLIIISESKNKIATMDGQTFHGMTIHNILEKVDLLNFMFDEDGNNEKQKEAGTSKIVTPGKAVMNASDPTSAYLGK